jgi:hypothetical protein
MRASVAHLAFGLLAWLPACRNQAFESCNAEVDATCVEATADVTATASIAGDAGDDTTRSGASAPSAPPNAVSASGSPAPGNSEVGDVGPTEPVIVSRERDGGSDATTGPTPKPPAPATSDDSAPSSVTANLDSGPSSPSGSGYTFGESLITNGDFADGNDFWSVERISGAGFMPEFADEELCVTGRGNARVVVGWPASASDSVSLPPGRYKFSYRIRGRGVHLWAKVGHAYEPYDILFEREWTGDEVGWHEVVHEFDFDGDDAVGVAFNIDLSSNADTLCFDEVALRRAVTGDASAP